MKLTIVGTGYVGLVTGTCLADFGNDVLCVDMDKTKIDLLKKGEIPIYEPGLRELVHKNVKQKRLSFSTDLPAAVKKSAVVMVCVGTPPLPSGEADLRAVFAVINEIGDTISKDGLSEKKYKVIVNKSTVPIGTGSKAENILRKKGISDKYFGIVSNPEFLREGSALNDSMRPNRVIIGSNSQKALDIMQELYRPLYLIETPFVRTDLQTAELIKYASNCFLAVKISFINEMANVSSSIGADVNVVAKAMGLDNRIGKYFLHAGPGYGGSCFPKDTKALIKICDKLGYDLKLVKAAEEVNTEQKHIVGKVVKKYFKNKLKGKMLAVLGLSFKPNTDDMRESPALTAIEDLLTMGAKVSAFDPVAMKECQKYLGKKIRYADSIADAVKKADGVIIMTEWNEFRELDLKGIKNTLRSPFFFDARNIYDPEKIRVLGFDYFCIGR